jgi:hypothetical protein
VGHPPDLAVLHAREELSLCSVVAFEFIGDEPPWDVQQALEELAEELLGCLRVAPTLHQDVEDIVVLSHRAPQVMALPVNGQQYCIQIPFVPELRSTATQPIGAGLPKLPTPFSDS